MPDPAAEKPVEKMKEAGQQTAKAETSSAAVRWYRTALFWSVLLTALVVFALLTFLVETTPSFPIDLQITLAIQSIDSPIFEGLMRVISWPGFFPQSAIITLLVAFTLYVSGFHWESITALLASFVSSVTNETVKYLIQRPRPAANLVDVFEVLSSYSFPSGHVMFYVSLFGFVWYLAYTLLKRSVKRSLLLGFFGGFIILVGVSRIYLGQHWASDVLGAYLLGSLLLVGIILLHQWGKTRFFVHQPVASPDSKKE
jgi:membrane-associated phospholipid phosphatase